MSTHPLLAQKGLSRQKGVRFHMLPRINLALMKFIPAIATSLPDSLKASKPKVKVDSPDQKGDRKSEEKPGNSAKDRNGQKAKSHLKLVQQLEKTVTNEPLAFATPFVQLLSVFESASTPVTQEEGVQIYIKNSVRLRKTGRARKGKILDRFSPD